MTLGERASSGDPALSRVQNARRRVLAVLFIVSVGALSMTRPAFAPGSFANGALFALGTGMIGLAIFIRFWASLYIAERKQRELVRGGPYAHVRNPLYLGTLFGVLGAGLVLGSLLIGVTATIVTCLVFHRVILHEERVLHGNFGAEFNRYCREVPRWRPLPGRQSQPSTLDVHVATVMRALAEALVFMAAIAVGPLVQAFRARDLTGLGLVLF